MSKAPNPPYLGPAAHTSGKGNKPIRRIVIHSTVSPCEPGGARKIAAYFRSARSGGSAHYVVDPGEVVQVVYDDVVAWHAPPNQHSIGVELCDMPDQNPRRWDNKAHREMEKRATRLVAELCVAYGVPPVYRDAKALKAGEHGVTTHRQVSLAFGQSSHWDPGAWRRVRFMREVRRQVKLLRG